MPRQYIIIVIDITGVKVANRGQRMRGKEHIKNNNKKKYLKIHFALNIKIKKILAVKVTYEQVYDNNSLPKLVNDIIKSD
ncbi:MAG TPA: transposase [Candidatus Nitrosocosmicus sp.]